MGLGQKKLLKFWLPDKAATARVSLQYLRTKQPHPSASEGHLSLCCLAWQRDLLFPSMWGWGGAGTCGEIWRWADKFCTSHKVARSRSCDSACLQQQQSWAWLASRKSPNFILHLFPQCAERKGNKYLLLCSLDPGLIPLTVLSLLLFILWLWSGPSMGKIEEVFTGGVEGGHCHPEKHGSINLCNVCLLEERQLFASAFPLCW